MHTDLPSSSASTPRTLHRLAWICVVLMLVVTSVSAWLRLAQPRPPCDDWPACRVDSARVLPAVSAPLLGAPVVLAAVRGVHRLTASVVLLVVVGMVVCALRQRPRRLLSESLLLLALALGLSVLGIVTPGSKAAAVLLGNLFGGFAMLALAWLVTRRLADTVSPAGAPGQAPRPRLAQWALAGALIWSVQVALGALSGAGAIAISPDLHILIALASGPWALVVGGTARVAGYTREGTALMVVAAMQPLLGAGAALSEAAAALVLAHNVGAAVGIALLVGLSRARGGARVGHSLAIAESC